MIKIQNEDTIIALATPAGTGAISVIRVSGSTAINVVDNLFYGKKKLSEAISHTIHYGKIKSRDDELIDDVLVSVLKSQTHTQEKMQLKLVLMEIRSLHKK